MEARKIHRRGQPLSFSPPVNADQEETISAWPGPPSSASDSVPDAPRQLGGFSILRHIGSGGMADVYLARWTTAPTPANALVALKLVQLAGGRRRQTLERLFEREARVAATLDHHNLVRVLDFGQIDGVHYIAMELVRGHALNRLLERAHLSASVAILIVSDVLRGLEYLHERRDERDKPMGLIHRDVSPHNVLVSYDGEVRLADFGLIKATELSDESTTGGMRGKAGYMSPEQAYGLRLDARSDLFAVGVMLFEMLAHRRLYDATDPLQRLTEARRAAIPDLDDLTQRHGARLAAILSRALQKNPNDRYQSARQMRAALAPLVVDSRQRLARLMQAEFSDASSRLQKMQRHPFNEDADRPRQAIDDGARQLSSRPEASSATGRLTLRTSRWRSSVAVRSAAVAVAIVTLVVLAWRLLPRETVQPQGTTAPEPRPWQRVMHEATDVRSASTRDAGVPRSPTDLGSMKPMVDASRKRSGRRPRRRRKKPGRAWISIGARPWARVYLNGRRLGTTPVVELSVPAGQHRLRLVSPVSGRTRRIRLILGDGQRYTRSFDLR